MFLKEKLKTYVTFFHFLKKKKKMLELVAEFETI